MRNKLSRVRLLCITLIAIIMSSTMAFAAAVPGAVLKGTDSVVRVEAEFSDGISSGSGFVIADDGSATYIATNWHVVEGKPRSLYVWVDENDTVSAEIYAYSEHKDLCILKLANTIPKKILKLDVGTVKQGDAVYAVGFPAAADDLSDTAAHSSKEATITDGIVSAIRTVTITETGKPVAILQISAAINAGNSGGPLFNHKGNVIGINTYGTYDSQGIFGAIITEELVSLMENHGLSPRSSYGVVPVIITALLTACLICGVFVFAVKRKRKKKSRVILETAPISQNIHCSGCGRMIPWENEFCHFCGTKVQRPDLDFAQNYAPESELSSTQRTTATNSQRYFDSDFGYSPDNPLVVSSVQMEGYYLSALRTVDGKAFSWERQPKNGNTQIDSYNLYVEGAFYRQIYFNPYGKDSEHLPEGLVLNQDAFNAARKGLSLEAFYFKQARAKKIKKRLMRGAIAACILTGLAVGGYFAYTAGLPYAKYRWAQYNWDSGNLEKALVAFESLGDYKDADLLEPQVRKSWAYSLYDSGRYQEAREQFEMLDYGEYKEIIDNCTYEFGVQLLDDKNYEGALNEFRQVLFLPAARDRLADCYYEFMLEVIKEKDWLTAYSHYCSVKMYDKNESTYAQKLKEVQYDVFIGYARTVLVSASLDQVKSVDTVLGELVGIYETPELSDLLNKVSAAKYKFASDYRKNAEYIDAIKLFEEIADYEDSRTQMIETMYEYISEYRVYFIDGLMPAAKTSIERSRNAAIQQDHKNTFFEYAKYLSDLNYKDARTYYRQAKASKYAKSVGITSTPSKESTQTVSQPEKSTATTEQTPSKSEGTRVTYRLYGVDYNVPDFGWYIGGTVVRSYTAGTDTISAYFHYDPSSLGVSVETAMNNYGEILGQYGFTFSHSFAGSRWYKNSEYSVHVGITNSIAGHPFQVVVMPH